MSSLNEAYNSLEKINTIEFKNKREDENEKVEKYKAHDALHDSIMTGKVFLKSLNILSNYNFKKKKFSKIFKEILESFENKTEFDKRTSFFKNRV
jgi:hypothetical protein